MNILTLSIIVFDVLVAAWIIMKSRSSVKNPASRKVELSDIEQCVRKEGFVPVRNDDFITFKVSGETIDVFYEEEKLSIARTYSLDADVNINLILKACSMLHDSVFMVRSRLHQYDNNQTGIVFEIHTMISSPTELERYFGAYLNILFHGIGYHGEMYGNLLKEASSTVGEEKKILS